MTHPLRVKNVGLWFSFYLIFIIFSVYISYYLNTLPPIKSELSVATLTISTADIPDNIKYKKVIPVSLPDRKMAEKLDITESWYTISIPDRMTLLKSQKLCIYIPFLGHNIEVFLNQQWLGNGGKMQSPIDRHTNHPLIFSFDRQQFKSTNNKLYIHLKGIHPEWTYLGKIYLGSEALLKPIYHKQKFLRINLVIVTTIALVFTSIFTALLWFLRRKETYYLWYSGAELLWAAHDTNLFLKQIPFSDAVWEAFIPLSFGWSILFFVFFIHSYIGKFNYKIDQFILFSGIALSIPFFFLDFSWNIFYGYKVWFIFILLIGVYITHFMMKHYLKTNDKNVLLMIFATFITMLFGIHDLLAATTLLPASSPYIMYLSAFLIILVISSILIRRFVASLNIVEHYNEVLQKQVKEKERELKQEYKKTQELQQQQILNTERERIMRDIHDGIGGQLVTTLAAIESPDMTMKEVKNNLKIALQDLRLVIDSLDGDAQDITTILGTLRMRLGDLLKKANIELIWKVQDLPMLEEFGPEKSLNTMRIIQEAITNVIKHSEATQLTISTYSLEKNEKILAIVEITDNGSGMIKGAPAGRGLYNMKRRAQRMDASIEMNSNNNTGMSVLLIFVCG